ncbi:MAG: LCP family protein [Deltaproteobacteria bacterium]|nr:LCP family protein [Deltaproteobacteria bacterium]
MIQHSRSLRIAIVLFAASLMGCDLGESPLKARVMLAVLDRDEWGANTDNIVVIDPQERKVTWVPRDLWSGVIQNRLNKAFALGGNELLIKALSEFGLRVSHGVTVWRTLVSDCLNNAEVVVPVPFELRFRYPLSPVTPIEEGYKMVSFSPPKEVLRGERIHQWLGARYGEIESGDLPRLRRQRTFFQAWMAAGYHCAPNPAKMRVTSEAAIGLLYEVSKNWKTETFMESSLVEEIINGKRVLRVKTLGSQKMPKKVVSVGQCAVDNGNIDRLIRSIGAAMIKVDMHSEVPEAIKKHEPSLVLVNRINDADGSSGLDLIRELKSSPETRAVPVMLISNYEEAQAEAIALGAVKGFGKAQISSGVPAELIRSCIN